MLVEWSSSEKLSRPSDISADIFVDTFAHFLQLETVDSKFHERRQCYWQGTILELAAAKRG